MNDKNYISLFSSVAIIVIGGFLFGGLVYNSDKTKAEIVDSVDSLIVEQSPSEDDASSLEVSVDGEENIDSIDPTKIVDIETRDDIDIIEEEIPSDTTVLSEPKDVPVEEEDKIIPEKKVTTEASRSKYISLSNNNTEGVQPSLSSIRYVSALMTGDDVFINFITVIPSKVNIVISNEEYGEHTISYSGISYRLSHFIRMDSSYLSTKYPNTISIFARSPRDTSSFISTLNLN